MNKAKLLGIAIIMVLALFLNADKALSTSYLLTAIADGNGTGSISLDIGGISYSYPLASTGSSMLDPGTPVTLTATANSGSTVAWSGACSSTGGTPTSATCTISSMTAAKTVTADYRLASCGFQPVKNHDTSAYYWTIQAAYNAAINSQSVWIQAGDFGEDVMLANTAPVILSGGYSCSYSPDSGITQVHGMMTIQGGAVTIENVEIDSGNAPITAGFTGTQSPGDFWTWSETTTSNGTISFSASNITLSHNYSGSETLLTGNSAGISNLNVTSTTDPNVTVPASAYTIEVPNTALLVVPSMIHYGLTGAQFSIQPPVYAAAQGSCPASGANLIWITMPTKSWCPTAGANNPYVSCASAGAGDAFGTAVVSVSNGTYDVTVNPHTLAGIPGSPFSFSGCTCSGGVIQCSGNTVRISFTPSGVFFVDTPTDSIVGLVQPDSNIDLNDFLAPGKLYKGVNYASLDSALWDVGASCPPSVDNCASYGGTCTSTVSSGVVCASPSTQLFSATANGSGLPVTVYKNIDNGTLSGVVGSISFGTTSQLLAPGLIQGHLASNCGSTDDMVMAVRKINNKYVGLVLHHSNCTTFNVGHNALMVEQ